MIPNTDTKEEKDGLTGQEQEKEEEEEEEVERGGTTGGTYCQVGPRGVAWVAPLSDSTHKRGGGQNISSGFQKRREGKQ